MAEHRRSTQNGGERMSVASRSRSRCRAAMDNRMVEWERHAAASRALTRARVKLKNARTKIGRLETELAIQRAHESEAAQQVLDLWPRVPARCRTYFNDDYEQTLDESREAAE